MFFVIRHQFIFCRCCLTSVSTSYRHYQFSPLLIYAFSYNDYIPFIFYSLLYLPFVSHSEYMATHFCLLSKTSALSFHSLLIHVLSNICSFCHLMPFSRQHSFSYSRAVFLAVSLRLSPSSVY